MIVVIDRLYYRRILVVVYRDLYYVIEVHVRWSFLDLAPSRGESSSRTLLCPRNYEQNSELSSDMALGGWETCFESPAGLLPIPKRLTRAGVKLVSVKQLVVLLLVK